MTMAWIYFFLRDFLAAFGLVFTAMLLVFGSSASEDFSISMAWPYALGLVVAWVKAEFIDWPKEFKQGSE